MQFSTLSILLLPLDFVAHQLSQIRLKLAIQSLWAELLDSLPGPLTHSQVSRNPHVSFDGGCLVLKPEVFEHHLGELFPQVGFIVTTLTGTNRAVVRFYNQRGTAEQWIKEGNAATHWTRLSCHRFRANEVRLLLGVIAYNLGNLLRRLVLPLTIQSWSLTSLQQRLFKTGGRLIRHARYFVLQLAEGHLTGSLFRQILGRIGRLTWHPT